MHYKLLTLLFLTHIVPQLCSSQNIHSATTSAPTTSTEKTIITSESKQHHNTVLDTVTNVSKIKDLILGYLDSWSETHSFKQNELTLDKFTIAPDGKSIAFISATAKVAIWDRASEKITDIIPQDTQDNATSLAYSNDGNYLAIGRSTGKIDIIDIEKNNIHKTVTVHKLPVARILFSPRNDVIASSKVPQDMVNRLQEDVGIHFSTIKTGQSSQFINQSYADFPSMMCPGPYILAFSPTNDFFAYVERSFFIDVISQSHGTTVKHCQTSSNGCGTTYAIAYSPCGKYLASGESSGSINIWNLQTQNPQTRTPTYTLSGDINGKTGHSANVFSVAYSPDGNYIVSGSLDKTVRIWDLQAGKNIVTLKGHRGPIYQVAYAADGHAIISASPENPTLSIPGDKTIRVWANTAHIIRQARFGTNQKK